MPIAALWANNQRKCRDFSSLGVECEGFMKRIATIVFIALLAGCQEPESVSEFTGNEISYELRPGSDYAVSGTISFKERVDGFTSVIIQLKGTDGTAKHPVHLHLGTISTPKADVAALLSPVTAADGKSVTLLDRLADETPILYKDLSAIEACIKIHLGETGPARDVILAGGNIGESYVKELSSGRQAGFAICK